VEWTLWDYRPILFGGAPWYEALQPPIGGEPSAWHVAKQPLGNRASHGAQVLNAAATFLQDHGLIERYKRLFAGINSLDLQPARAAAQGRTVTSPIFDIANEFIIARYLDRVLRWEYLEHEPVGRKGHRGDWFFRTPAGREVFVEVKSLSEPDAWPGDFMYTRPDYRPKIRAVVKGAYQQIPDDQCATLVVLAGEEILSISHGILVGDVAQALFGRFQIRFKPFSDDPDYRAGPSFRDQLVHSTKHRDLGAVAGFSVRGLDFPEPQFYAIDNPWAYPYRRIPDSDLAGARRFIVDDTGRGQELEGSSMEDARLRMCEPPRDGWPHE
jgi:hypothetical protein